MVDVELLFFVGLIIFVLYKLLSNLPHGLKITARESLTGMKWLLIIFVIVYILSLLGIVKM